MAVCTYVNLIKNEENINTYIYTIKALFTNFMKFNFWTKKNYLVAMPQLSLDCSGPDTFQTVVNKQQP